MTTEHLDTPVSRQRKLDQFSLSADTTGILFFARHTLAKITPPVTFLLSSVLRVYADDHQRLARVADPLRVMALYWLLVCQKVYVVVPGDEKFTSATAILVGFFTALILPQGKLFELQIELSSQPIELRVFHFSKSRPVVKTTHGAKHLRLHLYPIALQCSEIDQQDIVSTAGMAFDSRVKITINDFTGKLMSVNHSFLAVLLLEDSLRHKQHQNNCMAIRLDTLGSQQRSLRLLP
jgi:hypothetical protein